MCIFSAFYQNDRLNIAVVSVTVEQRVQRRKMLNKMTECILNALAFLFFLFFPTILVFTAKIRRLTPIYFKPSQKIDRWPRPQWVSTSEII